MRNSRSHEERCEREPECPVAADRERGSTDSRSHEVARLDRGSADTGHSQPKLRSEPEPTRAPGKRSATGDEAEDGEERHADPHRRAIRTEKRDRDRGGQGQPDEQGRLCPSTHRRKRKFPGT